MVAVRLVRLKVEVVVEHFLLAQLVLAGTL
jgi:hypothetical protein